MKTAVKKIIHVDNSEFFRKIMKTFLSEQGVDSEGYASGNDAFRQVETGRASLVIMGMSLSDMTGEEFMKKIVNGSRSVPVIAVTSDDDPKAKQMFLAIGLKDYILKSGPWQEQLLPHLKQL